MSEGKLSMKMMIPVIAITWILSLVTTLALVYFAPFAPLGTEKIGDSAVISDKLASGAVLTTKLADGSVNSAKIRDGAIIGQDIADGSIVSIEIVDGAITVTKIADGSVRTDKVADNAIITAKIADNAIVAPKLADESVTTNKLAESAVITIKLADGAVTTTKIMNGTIRTEDLADNSVTSVKITDNAITTTKIADYAVTSRKLAPDAIPFARISVITETSTTIAAFVDLPDTSVTITLNRSSHLLILLTAEFAINSTEHTIGLLALVDTNIAIPAYYQLAPTSDFYDAYTCSFYMPSVTAGAHSVRIRWCVGAPPALASAYYRTLTVIGLPA